MEYFLLVLMGLCFYALLCLSILLWKNNITFNIRLKWIDEIYDSQATGDKCLDWGDLPDYDETDADIKLWKYVPLKDYLNKEK